MFVLATSNRKWEKKYENPHGHSGGTVTFTFVLAEFLKMILYDF